MASANETVRDVCAEMRTYKHAEAFVGDECDFVDITGELADRILAAHEREIAQLVTECNRLKAALKPVMECDIVLWDDVSNAVREAQRIAKEGGEK